MGKPHSGWANREMFKSTSSRESSSSDLTNVSKVNFVLAWVTFQEVPAMKIDFRCTWKGIRTRKYFREKLLPPH